MVLLCVWFGKERKPFPQDARCSVPRILWSLPPVPFVETSASRLAAIFATEVILSRMPNGKSDSGSKMEKFLTGPATLSTGFTSK